MVRKVLEEGDVAELVVCDRECTVSARTGANIPLFFFCFTFIGMEFAFYFGDGGDLHYYPASYPARTNPPEVIS